MTVIHWLEETFPPSNTSENQFEVVNNSNNKVLHCSFVTHSLHQTTQQSESSIVAGIIPPNLLLDLH